MAIRIWEMKAAQLIQQHKSEEDECSRGIGKVAHDLFLPHDHNDDVLHNNGCAGIQ